MNHKVNNVGQLYNDASSLYKNVVLGTADTIINDLYQGINALKSSWEGKDAGVQIQNVIEVHNGMVAIRNALAELSKDSSLVAVKYREIQNVNRANLEALSPIAIETKNFTESYSDARDTINITPEANNGKNRIDAANNAIYGFINDVRKYYDMIMSNWQVGTGREKAESAFSEFMGKSNKYKETLAAVSQSITDALKNYQY